MQLHIPKPCTASWENMTPQGQGRHCDACAKQVVDFTKMTDEEVLQFLGSAPGSLCGRMTGAQMQRDLGAVQPEVRRVAGRRLFHYGLGALFALLAGATGCDRRRTVGKIVVPPAQTKADTNEFVTTGVVLRLPDTDTVCLTAVSDMGGRPIQGASVLIKGKKGVTATDEHGKADLPFPGDVDSVTLQVSAPGYATNIFSVRRPGFPGDYPHIRVKVEMEEIKMGEIAIPPQRINPG